MGRAQWLETNIQSGAVRVAAQTRIRE